MSTLIGSLMSVASIVGKWKLFEDNGQEGWKAVIPYYSSYIFSKTFNEEKLGRILAWSEAVFVMSFIPLCILLFIPFILTVFSTMVSSLGIVSDSSFWKDMFNALSDTGRISIIVLLIVMVISLILMIYSYITLHYRYTLFQNVSIWFMLIWVLLPCVGYLYFAFREKQTDIL